MNKQEAIGRIAKLDRVVKNSASSPNEIDTARKSIAELTQRFGLTAFDLQVSAKAEAFDDLMKELDRYLTKKSDQLPPAVFDVISRIQRDVSEMEKADSLDKIVAGIRVASMLFGFNKSVAGIKKTITVVLEKHQISI
jgi:hypothetical protein